MRNEDLRSQEKACGLQGLLAQAQVAASDAPLDLSQVGADLGSLAQRLSEQRFHLAVVGQFKRGKSTLLNALLGEALLPSAVLPLTAVPTFVRSGRERMVSVSYTDGRSDDVHGSLNLTQARDLLQAVVTEQGNPKNRLSVLAVQVHHPSSFLQQGVVLIDTPGIGSTLRHNTDVTLRFLPQCDAALFVVSADPPITQAEAEFLTEVRRVAKRMFVVLNKSDYLSKNETAEVVDFLRDFLSRGTAMMDDAPIFAVSARDGLKARMDGNPEAWAASGMHALEEHLVGFQIREKTATLVEALAAKASGILDDALQQLALMRRALELPVKDLDARLDTFERLVGDIQSAQQAALDILEGDRLRAMAYLEDQAETLRIQLRKRFTAIADEVIESDPAAADVEQRALESIATAIPALLENKLAGMSTDLRRLTAGVLEPHRTRAGELVARVYRAAAETFDLPSLHGAPAGEFELKHEPYWVRHDWNTALAILPPQAVDRLLPARVRVGRIRRRIGESIDSLVVRNVENLRWAALQGLQAAFRRFVRQYEDHLAQVVRLTLHAVTAARTLRAESEAKASQGQAESASTERLLAEIRESIGALQGQKGAETHGNTGDRPREEHANS